MTRDVPLSFCQRGRPDRTLTFVRIFGDVSRAKYPCCLSALGDSCVVLCGVLTRRAANRELWEGRRTITAHLRSCRFVHPAVVCVCVFFPSFPGC